MRRVLGAVASARLAPPAQTLPPSYDPNRDPYPFVGETAHCSGLFAAYKDAFKKSNQPASSETAGNSAAGYRQVAHFAAIELKAMSVEQQDKIVEDPIGPEKTRSLSFFEQDWADDQLIDIRNALDPLVSGIIEPAREEGYLGGRKFGDPRATRRRMLPAPLIAPNRHCVIDG